MASEKKLSHLDEQGAARMVDVADKEDTRRRAVAEAVVSLSPSTLEVLREGAPKGDVIATARIAGIQATKRTAELIPLCHPLALTRVGVDLTVEEAPPAVRITCTAECKGPTGVEMEALTGASVAALTIYDMLKAVDRGM
ncbi:MAG: cyclic pyranopterin monophosphate synthase MoaC, partial [Deltaproteobacteria bacterium]|nr:cyclic pyranopterin monophosphate synthase MoaC [Deltaproteobacteria bacterium]